MDYNFYKFQKQFSENLQSYKGILESEVVKNFYFNPETLSVFYISYFSLSSSLMLPHSKVVKTIILNPTHPDCLIACEKGQNWNTYYPFVDSFSSKEERLLYCKRQCLSYTNLEFDKRILKINTRFFDFTSLREYFEK